MQRSDSIAALAKALAFAQGKFESAKKEAINPHFKTRYADLNSILDVCRKPLSDNGLALIQTTRVPENGDLLAVCVETTLMHESGEWISGDLFLPVVKADPQSYGATLTYARRYALQAMLGIAPEDDDCQRSTGSDRRTGDGDRGYTNGGSENAPLTLTLEIARGDIEVIKNVKVLGEWWNRWSSEIAASEHKKEITAAFQARLKELKDAKG